jgi:AcrR family transcriptional regulator
MTPRRSDHETAPTEPVAEGARPRHRDPERTKTALLEAALVEFADKGLAGARVDEIAARAGVNKQLISYYFGGKEGLHQALSDKWRTQDEAIIDPSRPLEDVVDGFLKAVYQDPDRARFSIREAIDQDPSDTAFEPDASGVADIRERQKTGEIANDLDPAFVLLVISSAVMSGAVFPVETKRTLGLDPGSPEYISHMSEQLRRLMRRLADPPDPSD